MSELVGGGEGGGGGGEATYSTAARYTLPEAVTFRFLPGGKGREGKMLQLGKYFHSLEQTGI